MSVYIIYKENFSRYITNHKGFISVYTAQRTNTQTVSGVAIRKSFKIKNSSDNYLFLFIHSKNKD